MYFAPTSRAVTEVFRETCKSAEYCSRGVTALTQAVDYITAQSNGVRGELLRFVMFGGRCSEQRQRR